MNNNNINNNWRSNPNKRIVLDNGSSRIRLGNATSEKPFENWYNMVATDKTNGNKLMGEDILKIWDETKVIYQRSNVRGATMKFDQQITLWEEMLVRLPQVEAKKTGLDMSDCSLTFPLLPHLPHCVLERYFEVFFEYFNFDAVLPQHASEFIYEKAKNDYSRQTMAAGFELSPKYCLVVETSDSATYLSPFLDGRLQKKAIRKVDVGGKLLTNWLKDTLSFRHLDLKNSDLLIKQIKEDLCYVSSDFVADMRKCSSGKQGAAAYAKHFILPDEELMKRGYASDTWDENSYSQKITLDKQRIQVPEILFSPQDIGLEQCGIVEAVLETLEFAHEDVRHNFLKNIVLTGGNTGFAGFSQRLYRDLRKECPNWVKPQLYMMNQKDEVFEAAVAVTKKPVFEELVISRSEYREKGFSNMQNIF